VFFYLGTRAGCSLQLLGAATRPTPYIPMHLKYPTWPRGSKSRTCGVFAAIPGAKQLRRSSSQNDLPGTDTIMKQSVKAPYLCGSMLRRTPAPRIAAESPQRARSASVVHARTCSAEPEFGAQTKKNYKPKIDDALRALARQHVVVSLMKVEGIIYYSSLHPAKLLERCLE
jgi:hypothetical protein